MGAHEKYRGGGGGQGPERRFLRTRRDSQLPLGTQKTACTQRRALPPLRGSTSYTLPQGLAQVHYSGGRTETRPMSLKVLWVQELHSNTIVLPVLFATTGTGICYHEDKKIEQS